MIEILQSAIEATAKTLIERITHKGTKLVSKGTRTYIHRFLIDPGIASTNISLHNSEMLNWCSSISHHGVASAVPLENVFVSMKLNDDQKRYRLGKTSKRIDANKVLRERNNLIFVGDLGSGKTTLLQKYFIDIVRSSDLNKKCAIFIRLRDVSEHSSFLRSMEDIFQISFERAEQAEEDERIKYGGDFDKVRVRALAAFCDKLNMTIILDGLDEAPRPIIGKIQEEVDNFSMHISSCRIILSSRSAEVSRSFKKIDIYEVEAFDEQDSFQLAEKWFQSVDPSKDPKKTTLKFIEELKNLPYHDISNRPLMLTNLCIIYQKYKSLPPRPYSIYDKIVNLCLEEWDAQRGVRRISKYASLDSLFKFRFLSHFAYELAIKTDGKMTFDRKLCEEIYSKVHQYFSLPAHEYREVADDIESTTGIIVRATYDRYEFSHKSIYEYLVAEHLVRSGKDGFDFRVLQTCPNETAIAVAISSSPDHWIKGVFVDKGITVTRDATWIRTFLRRLELENPSFGTSREVAFAALAAYTPLQHEEIPTEFSWFLQLRSVEKSLFSFFNSNVIETTGDIIQIRYELVDAGRKNIISQQFSRKNFTKYFGDFIERG